MRKLLTDRLMTLLKGEIAALEAEVKTGARSSKAKPETTGTSPADAEVAAGDGGKAAAAQGKRTAGRKASTVPSPAGRREGRKERIDSLVQLTRTMEKLLDLKRLETLTERGGEEDAAETLRLRDELMARLKVLDRRRQLFADREADAVPSDPVTPAATTDSARPGPSESCMDRADDIR